MSKTAKAIHLVCRKGKNVSELRPESFKTGRWVIAKKHLRKGLFVALHEKKAERSYLQGEYESHDLSDKGKNIVKLIRIDQPLVWVGDGSGERGYDYGEPSGS